MKHNLTELDEGQAKIILIEEELRKDIRLLEEEMKKSCNKNTMDASMKNSIIKER